MAEKVNLNKAIDPIRKFINLKNKKNLIETNENVVSTDNEKEALGFFIQKIDETLNQYGSTKEVQYMVNIRVTIKRLTIRKLTSILRIF